MMKRSPLLSYVRRLDAYGQQNPSIAVLIILGLAGFGTVLYLIFA